MSQKGSKMDDYFIYESNILKDTQSSRLYIKYNSKNILINLFDNNNLSYPEVIHECVNFSDEPIKFCLNEEKTFYYCYGLDFEDNIFISENIYTLLNENDKHKLYFFLKKAAEFLNSLLINKIFENKIEFESLAENRHKPSAFFLEKAHALGWKEELIYSNSTDIRPSTTEIYKISKNEKIFLYYSFTDWIDEEIIIKYDDEIEDEIEKMIYKENERKSLLFKVITILIIFIISSSFILYTYYKGESNKEINDMNRFKSLEDRYFKKNNFYDCSSETEKNFFLLKNKINRAKKLTVGNNDWLQKKYEDFFLNTQEQYKHYKVLINFQKNIYIHNPSRVSINYFNDFKQAVDSCFKIKKLNLTLPELNIDNKKSLFFQSLIDKFIEEKKLDKAIETFEIQIEYEFDNISHYLDDVKTTIDEYKDFINIFSLPQNKYLKKLIVILEKDEKNLNYKQKFYLEKYIKYIEELTKNNLTSEFLKKNQKRKFVYDSKTN